MANAPVGYPFSSNWLQFQVQFIANNFKSFFSSAGSSPSGSIISSTISSLGSAITAVSPYSISVSGWLDKSFGTALSNTFESPYKDAVSTALSQVAYGSIGETLHKIAKIAKVPTQNQYFTEQAYTGSDWFTVALNVNFFAQSSALKEVAIPVKQLKALASPSVGGWGGLYGPTPVADYISNAGFGALGLYIIMKVGSPPWLYLYPVVIRQVDVTWDTKMGRAENGINYPMSARVALVIQTWTVASGQDLDTYMQTPSFFVSS